MTFNQEISFKQTTANALQSSAALLRQNNEKEAYSILCDEIYMNQSDNPNQGDKLTENQVNAVYGSIIHDPHEPKTEFAKRQFQPLMVIKAQALMDVVAFYSACPSKGGFGSELNCNTVKQAILDAAHLLQTTGDMDSAWKILDDVLPAAQREEYPMVSEEVVKEVYRIMVDSLRTPTSSFLQKRMRENSGAADDNRLRAKALESLSLHLFDAEVVNGEAPRFKVGPMPSQIYAHEVLTKLEPKEHMAVRSSSRTMKQAVKDSLKYRKEATWKEVSKWMRMGIKLDKETLASLEVIRGEGARRIDDKALEYICSHCPNLKEIDLGSNKIVTGEIFSIVGKHCKKLVSFILSDNPTRISYDTLEKLTSGCNLLEHLCFKNCQLGAGSLAAVSKHCPELRSLDISSNYGLQEKDIETLVEGCKKLTHFAASRSRGLGDGMLRALAKCPLLESIKFEGASNGESHFTEAAMKNFVQGCRALNELEFRFCCLPDNILRVIGEAGLPIRKININHNGNLNENMTSAGIIALLQGCPNLLEAELTNCKLDDETLDALAAHCPLVTHLNISNNPDFSSQGLQSVAQRCSRLRQLTLADSSERGEGFLGVLTESPSSLTSIDFASFLVDHITIEEIIAFLKRNPDLTHINLPGDRVTDEMLVAIGQYCPKLQSIKGLFNATPKGLGALGRGCPHLTSLDVGHNVSGDLLKAIGENFPELTQLNLAYSNRRCFTLDGIKALGKGCRNLTELNVTSCDLNDAHIEAIAKVCPQLKMLNYCDNKVSDSVRVVVQRHCRGVTINRTFWGNSVEVL